VAIDIDVGDQRTLARHPNILWREISSPFRRRLRVFLRSWSRGDLNKLRLDNDNETVCDQFNADEIAPFRDHGWLLIEDFLPNEVYFRLASYWSSKRWFTSLSKGEVNKTYDKAFKTYVKSDLDAVVPMELSLAYRFFSSKEFEAQIAALSADSAAMRF